MADILEVRGISKYYGSRRAIDGISFSVQAGQLVGLLGQNGSGKTTTMNIIANCLAATQGEVRIEGISLARQPLEAKKRIGYLPEHPPLYTDMTVEEQLRFACGLRGIFGKKASAQIEEVCIGLNIHQVKKRLINNLSKGYRQRIGFAQALLGAPKLLIFDEPMVGLDPQQIIDLREQLIRLKQTHAIIISSHILAELAVICDRLLILSKGRLVADDSLEGLTRQAEQCGEWLLQADGEQERLLSLIRALPQVERCELRTGQNGREVEYHIYSSDRQVYRSLFQCLAQENCPIRLLKPVYADLEEIFLRLTNEK